MNRTATPGTPSSLLPHVGLEVLEAARAVWLQDDQDVGQRVRHRVFGALSATRSSHHVLNLGNLAQDVFNSMIQAIDFLERGLGGKHGLQKERPLIQLRHEVAADAKSEGDGRHGDQKRHQSHEPRVSKAAVEQRRIPLLDLSEQDHVFVSSGSRGTQDHGGSDRDERQRQHERRDHGRDDGRRQRLIHPTLDARHAKERQEHDDHDEGREGDGPRHFNGRGDRPLPTFAPGRGTAEPVQDVLDHDDRRVDQQADGDRQPAERHRVQVRH